jgi:hypothetical protein
MNYKKCARKGLCPDYPGIFLDSLRKSRETSVKIVGPGPNCKPRELHQQAKNSRRNIPQKDVSERRVLIPFLLLTQRNTVIIK